MLRDDLHQTMPIARASLARARNEPGAVDLRNPRLFLESLSISDAEKEQALNLARLTENKIDPVVSVIIAATNGLLYKHLIGKLNNYPIPDFRLPTGDNKILLDIGCNWGRWSIAAARKGYKVIGIDPSLGAIMAAKRVARQLDLDIEYLVADGRYLPFENESFDVVFSYSVIQHFSKEDALRTIKEISRILKLKPKEGR
jgi:2-polyprenyl-3-methyl-5-hydroxy-6-metoxy-1,4-benzoquinol methylase